MVKTFRVGIYSSDRVVYEGEAVSLIAPAALGFLGVLADHAPLAAKLSAGKITLRTQEGNTSVIESSPSGFLQVLQNQVTLLL
jgi:F-type H+-transporting ATPase subunit epsilon